MHTELSMTCKDERNSSISSRVFMHLSRQIDKLSYKQALENFKKEQEVWDLWLFWTGITFQEYTQIHMTQMRALFKFDRIFETHLKQRSPLINFYLVELVCFSQLDFNRFEVLFRLSVIPKSLRKSNQDTLYKAFSASLNNLLLGSASHQSPTLFTLTLNSFPVCKRSNSLVTNSVSFLTKSSGLWSGTNLTLHKQAWYGALYRNLTAVQ